MGILVIFQPGAAVGALLCTYGLEQWAQSQSSFFYEHQIFTNAATGLLVALALTVRFMRGERILTPVTREYWVMVAIYVWAAMSLIWTVYPEAQGSFFQFKKNLPYIILFGFLTPPLINNLRDLKSSFYLMVVVGVFLMTWMLFFTKWSDRQIILEQGASIGSVVGNTGSPLAVATLGGQVALIALLMNWRLDDARFWGKLILRFAVILLGVAITVRSGSRGQGFALLVTAAVFLPLSVRPRNLPAFLGMIVVGGVIAYGSYVAFETYSYTRTWTGGAFWKAFQQGRVNTTLELLGHWVDAGPFAWLIGLGSSASFDPNIVGFYPHMVFGEVLGELGLVGFVILWLCPIFGFLAIYRLWLYVKDFPEERGLVMGLGALFLFDIVLSFKQGSLLGSMTTFAFAAMLGRILWDFRRQEEEYHAMEAQGTHDDEFGYAPEDERSEEEYAEQAAMR